VSTTAALGRRAIPFKIKRGTLDFDQACDAAIVHPAARNFPYDTLAETTIAVLWAWAPAKRGATLHLTLLIVYSMPACELATVVIAGHSAVQHALSWYRNAVLDREKINEGEVARIVSTS
jgi:hypothetical protein